ncbi:LysR family transcriptional regulator [Marinospirillum sp. MEB164]|uniref:LysR family transcriptional regulator n=1 Tax=Marinospirillum alkalitolerans TaxID=3123374 RepID=A0ABW8PTD2_9GAMM
MNINLKHLHYFWLIAREGSIAQAAERLDLAPQTLSAQLASLETHLGQTLFRRAHRRLQMTDSGQWLYRYAEQIFALAEEMETGWTQREPQAPIQLTVGVAASIHKLIAYQLIQPALSLDRPIHLRCHTGQTSDFILALKKQRLDVLLTDQLPQAITETDWVITELLRSPISLFAAEPLASRLKADFPASLHQQPLLATSYTTPYFQQLMLWFQQHQITPGFVAEIDDSALIKVFGHHGQGLFAAPAAIRAEVCRQYQVKELARLDGVKDVIYALSRRASTQHLGVQAILQVNTSKKPDDRAD